MDFNDPAVRRVFFEVHRDLPREGPGSRDSTARALALAGTLPARPRVLDIACGPGAQTIDLAGLLPEAEITALDNHAPFLADLERCAAARGLSARIETREGDMAALPFAPGSFDLIWCEGAAYLMGVGAALRAWRPLLRPGGRLALSEAVWLRRDPPERLRQFWTEYPAMGDIEACRRLVRESGYALLGDFVLPESAWWDDYYAPMAARLDALAPRLAGDAVAEAVLREHREEIAMWREFAGWYGYVFLVMAAA